MMQAYVLDDANVGEEGMEFVLLAIEGESSDEDRASVGLILAKIRCLGRLMGIGRLLPDVIRKNLVRGVVAQGLP